MTFIQPLRPASKADVREALEQILAQRVMVLDGAMGTMIQGYGLQEADFRGDVFGDVKANLKGDNELLSITRPDIILDIHNKFLAAGADILETNTFGATAVAQGDYGLSKHARSLNVAAARLARQAVDE